MMCLKISAPSNAVSVHKELLGHSDIRTTEINLHTMRDPSRDTSVLDQLDISVVMPPLVIVI